MNVSDFVRLYQVRAPNIMWFLGAGASAAGAVPTAYHMIWKFKQMLYCSDQRVSVKACADLGDPSLRARLQQYFDSKPGFPPLDSDQEYACYFEAALPAEADRRRYIGEAFSGASPSYGHIALAALMKMKKARIVWTTNFDPLIEDAVGRVYGQSGILTTATPDSSSLAMETISEERYPLLVKVHGDFRSRRLKNTSEELRAQDAELRRALVEACKRYGLSVVGYSGRDHSVMDSLEEAIYEGKGFPFGLFWFHRPESPCSPRILQLLEHAERSGIQAELIEAETFDELFGDLLLLVPDIPEEVQECLSGYAPRVSDAPLPSGRGSWPVVRLNALPVTSAPTVCRRVVCGIGGAKEVRQAVEDGGSDIVAGRRRSGVIAFGEDSEIRRVFEPYGISDFDVHTVEPRRLRYESAEHGLLYDAICRAFERERPLIVQRKRQARVICIDPAQSEDELLRPLKEAADSITGTVPGTGVVWTEAIEIRLEYKSGLLWLLIEPTIWADRTDDEAFARSREFIRGRLASRYNATWNSLIDAWSGVLTGGQDECTVRAFGIDDGCDASFTISRITGFSRRERA